VTPRSWEWFVPADRALGAPAHVTVTVSGGRLEYRGFYTDPGWGGDYDIGTQTAAAFLTGGPLDADMPDEVAAGIRAFLTPAP
jgi:hypothetical protein